MLKGPALTFGEIGELAGVALIKHTFLPVFSGYLLILGLLHDPSPNYMMETRPLLDCLPGLNHTDLPVLPDCRRSCSCLAQRKRRLRSSVFI